MTVARFYGKPAKQMCYSYCQAIYYTLPWNIESTSKVDNGKLTILGETTIQINQAVVCFDLGKEKNIWRLGIL